MIYGYPGSTHRYETSYGVKLATDVTNGAIVRLRDARLRLMMEQMEKDPAVRLKLASNYASIANYWKFFDGEKKQLLKYDVYGQKKKEEDKFTAWGKGKPGYEDLFSRYSTTYDAWTPYSQHRVYHIEGILGSPLAALAARLAPLEAALKKADPSVEPGTSPSKTDIDRITASLVDARKNFIEEEDIASDRAIMATMTMMYHRDINPSQQPVEFFSKLKAYRDLDSQATYDKMASYIFDNTLLLKDDRWNAFIAKPDLTTLQSDPAYAYVSTFINNYNAVVAKPFADLTVTNNDLGRTYLKGVMEMNPKKIMYPDATFTMRVSYGNVRSYVPRDAVHYNYVCTLTGVMEKYKPGNYEFDLPANLIQAYQQKNFGAYKDATTNDIVVNFITTNDITGGNSGSPVLNGNGELIGLAFDGNYEALSHRIAFDKDLNRTICVDVRYVLWCIDVLGGAKNIISELTLK
jgi:hypothetical protein